MSIITERRLWLLIAAGFGFPAVGWVAIIARNAIQDAREPDATSGMAQIRGGQLVLDNGQQLDIPSFYIDLTEVTAAEFTECVRFGGCIRSAPTALSPAGRLGPECNLGRPDRLMHPMNCVRWSQARGYCRWSGKRLPTSTEWQYAARGTDSRTYPWGDATPNGTLLNGCGQECVSRMRWPDNKPMYREDDGWTETAPVGSYPGGASPFGVLDLEGNVSEWVDDFLCDDFDARNLPVPACTQRQTVRGSNWMNTSAESARITGSWSATEIAEEPTLGFRCAL